MAFFPKIKKIKYEGPDSKNPLSFKWYNENEIVAGRGGQHHMAEARILSLQHVGRTAVRDVAAGRGNAHIFAERRHQPRQHLRDPAAKARQPRRVIGRRPARRGQFRAMLRGNALGFEGKALVHGNHCTMKLRK